VDWFGASPPCIARTKFVFAEGTSPSSAACGWAAGNICCSNACRVSANGFAFLIRLPTTFAPCASYHSKIRAGSISVFSSGYQSRVMMTNSAGNFMLLDQGNTLAYPLWLKVRYNGVSVPMDSRVFRDGSCATCHGMQYGPDSAGPVHLLEDQFSDLAALFPDPGCPPP
jgi:hypothetical protein